MRSVVRVVAAAVLVLLGGCAAARLPSGPSAEDARLVAAHPRAGRCVVTSGRAGAGRTELASALAATGLFERVDVGSESDLPPDAVWVVREHNVAWVDPFNGGCPHSAQVVTMLTFGIVPTVITRDGVWLVEIRRAADDVIGRRAFYVGEPVTSVGGWLALPMLLCPWWWRYPTDDWGTGREAELLAVAIVKTGALDEAVPGR